MGNYILALKFKFRALMGDKNTKKSKNKNSEVVIKLETCLNSYNSWYVNLLRSMKWTEIGKSP